MARKKRSDSIEASVEAMKRVLDGAPTPPDFCAILPKHMPFWNAIMSTKDYSMWTPNDLIVAAGLARIQCEIEQYANSIEKQTRLIDDGRSISLSPLHKIMSDLQSQQTALCRTLQIHARATHGESRDQGKRNTTFSQSRKNAKNTENVMSLIKRA